jgi:hypothetical protein
MIIDDCKEGQAVAMHDGSNGILNPRRRLLGGYDFSGDDIDSALVARDITQRRLELVGPGLARYQRRRREGGRTSTMGLRRPRTGLDDVRSRFRSGCPRCGFAMGLR